MASIMKNFFSVILMPTLLYPLLLLMVLIVLGIPIHRDQPSGHRMVGQVITLSHPLLLFHTPEKGLTGTWAATLTDCSGCYQEENHLVDVLARGTRIRVVRSFNHTALVRDLFGRPMEYLVLETVSDGRGFMSPAFLIESGPVNGGGFGDEILNAFGSATEMKGFYIQARPADQAIKFPGRKPPFSRQETEEFFAPVISGLKGYNAQDIKFNDGHLAFTVTTDRVGAARLITMSSDLSIEISPYKTVKPVEQPEQQ